MWKQKLRQWSRQHSTALVCGQEDTVRPRHSKASLKPEPVMRIHLREGMKASRHASISMGIVTKTCSVAGWWRREGVESPKFNNGVNVGKKNSQALEPTSKNYQLKYPTVKWQPWLKSFVEESTWDTSTEVKTRRIGGRAVMVFLLLSTFH